jgi:hypothetical protein
MSYERYRLNGQVHKGEGAHQVQALREQLVSPEEEEMLQMRLSRF